MSEQARLRLRSIRTSDELWERISQTAASQGRSASQVAAEAMRAYVDGPAAGPESPASSAQEPPGAPRAPADPRQAPSAAPASVLLPSRPPRRPPADETPQPLEDPAHCQHPEASRFRGRGVAEHCRACGAAFGPTLSGWGTVVPAEEL